MTLIVQFAEWRSGHYYFKLFLTILLNRGKKIIREEMSTFIGLGFISARITRLNRNSFSEGVNNFIKFWERKFIYPDHSFSRISKYLSQNHDEVNRYSMTNESNFYYGRHSLMFITLLSRLRVVDRLENEFSKKKLIKLILYLVTIHVWLLFGFLIEFETA